MTELYIRVKLEKANGPVYAGTPSDQTLGGSEGPEETVTITIPTE
jgi:hypothetical protein